MKKYSFLIIFFSQFCIASLNTEKNNNTQNVHSQLKKNLNQFLEVFINNDIVYLGKAKPYSLKTLQQSLDTIEFRELDSVSFSKLPNKTRRSAFYKDEGNIIFINKNDPPSPQLLLHEIFKDKNYEVSAAMSALYNVLISGEKSWFSLTKIKSLKLLIDHVVDQYGIDGEYIRSWHTEELNTMRTQNAKLLLNEGEGGDVSGGGGDNLGLEVKIRVFNLLLDDLLNLYLDELGFTNQDDIEYFLGDRLLKVTAYMYFESKYSKDTAIDFLITTDPFKDLELIPYLIKIPTQGRSIESLAQEIKNLIMQTDLTLFEKNIKKHYSPCKCAKSNKLSFWGFCPRKEKMHPAFSETIDYFIKQNQCVYK